MSIFENLSLVALAVLAIAIAGSVAWRWWSNYQKYLSLRSLPSPPGNWLLGNLLQLLDVAKKHQYFQFLRDWALQLGPMYVLWVGSRPTLILSKPKVIEKILVHNHKDGSIVRSPQLRELWGELFGAPITIAQEGTEWQWRRQTFNQSLASSRIPAYLEMIEKACQQVIDICRDKAQRQEIVPVDPLFATLTMRIICRLSLGIPLEGNSPANEGPPLEPDKLYEALSVVTSQFITEAVGGNKWLKYLPTPSGQKYWAARRFLQQFVSPRVNLALAIAKHDRQLNSLKSDSLLEKSILVQLAKQPRFTTQMLCAETIGLIFAGTDTTAHTLSFTLGALGLNPLVFDQARQEVDLLWKRHDGITSESLKELTYLQGVIKEAMRLYPVSNGSTGCIAVRDTVIEGCNIPQDTNINWSIMAAGRNPEEYPNPDEFLPERWLFDKQKNRSPLTFLVFGSGPHRCLGESLAILEATVMLAMLLRYFDWEVVNGHASLEKLGQNLTVFPEDRMPIKFKVRKFAQQTVDAN